jgi:CRP/FNR family transcriptional regulator
MIDFKKIPIFSTLNASDMEEVKPYLIPAKFKKKESIFSEGDSSDWLYVVIKGKVKITKLSQSGREIILEIISPMDFFGGVAVMRGFPYPANAVAMDDAEVLKISRSNLMRILDRFPNLMYCMAMNIGDRIKGSHEALKNIAVEKVESRIASMLIKLADKAGSEPLGDDSVAIDMKLTKQDIAEMVGTTVETSIRTMSKLKKLGIVSEKSGKIVIKDLTKLKSLCS